MILITGATGQLGSAVIKQLSKLIPVQEIAALARDAQKTKWIQDLGIEVRIGDFDQPASLKDAMKGIDQVLLISTISENRFDQHKNVIDAAKEAGVRKVYYTGVSMRDLATSFNKPLMNSHFETEDYLKSSGLNYGFLRNSLYMDVIPMFIGAEAINKGVFFPAGDGKVPFVLREEMGEAIGTILAAKYEENQVLEIAAEEVYSFSEIAKALSEISGTEIPYVDLPETDFKQALQQANVPDYVIDFTLAFAADIKSHQFETGKSDLEKWLKRKPSDLKASLKKLF